MCRTGRTGWQTITATCFSRKSSITFGSSSCSSYSTATALGALVMTHYSLSVSAWSMQGRIHSVTAVCPTHPPHRSVTSDSQMASFFPEPVPFMEPNFETSFETSFRVQSLAPCFLGNQALELSTGAGGFTWPTQMATWEMFSKKEARSSQSRCRI